jgi:hypothetical protein
MNALKPGPSFWIFALALAVTASHEIAQPQRLPAADSDPVVTLSPTVADPVLDTSPRSQALFYQELEGTAMRFYDLHKAHMPHVKRNLWQRMMREMVLSMEEAKFGLKAISRASRPARRSMMVTAVLSNVLPIPLLWLGAKALAGIVLAVPFELIVPPAQMAMLSARDLMKEIWTLGNDGSEAQAWLARWKRGLSTYQASRELRRQLLGMPERAHILTLIDERIMRAVDADPNNHWISISRANSSNRGLLGQSVDLSELEAIARKVENGPALLNELRSERAQSDVYAMEVWHLIQSEEATREELQDLLRPRLRNTVGNDTVRLARHMAEARDLKRQIIITEESVADAMKSAQNGANAADKAGLKRLMSDMTEASLKITKAMSEVETQILIAQLRGETTPMTMEPIVALARDIQRRYGQVLPMARAFSEDRRVTVASLRSALDLPAALPSTPGRLASSFNSCAASIASLLSKMSATP